MNKFLKHSLNVKGDAKQSQTKGWTRRAGKELRFTLAPTIDLLTFSCVANLGVMKRSGPAAHFVRGS